MKRRIETRPVAMIFVLALAGCAIKEQKQTFEPLPTSSHQPSTSNSIENIEQETAVPTPATPVESITESTSKTPSIHFPYIAPVAQSTEVASTEQEQPETSMLSEGQISFLNLGQVDASWRGSLAHCGFPNSIILEDGDIIQSSKAKCLSPSPVEFQNVRVRKSRGVSGEAVYTVEGILIGTDLLSELVGERSFVRIEGIIFQESPGTLKGTICVWEKTGFKQWIESSTQKRFLLIDSPLFQDWALRKNGTLILIAYTYLAPMKDGKNVTADYYILGGKGMVF